MTSPADGGSAHRALLYTGEREFRAAVGTFIREGLARGEQILAAVPAGQLAWIRAELGGDPRRSITPTRPPSTHATAGRPAPCSTGSAATRVRARGSG